MAERAVTRVTLPGLDGEAIALFKWEGLLNGDTGAPLELNAFSDKSFQIHGTAGAGLAAKLQGDNSGDDDNFFDLLKADGTALSLAAVPAGAQVMDHTRRVRPSVTGDGTTAITALLYVISPRG